MLTITPELDLRELAESRRARRALAEILGLSGDAWEEVTSSLAHVHEKLLEIADCEMTLEEVADELERQDAKTQEQLKQLEDLESETASPSAGVVRLFSLMGISELQLSVVLQSSDPERTLLHEIEYNARRFDKGRIR